MFESTLIASRRQKTPRQRLLALPVAVALHLVALSGFVLGQLVTTGPVPEPTLMISFYQPPPPPRPIGLPSGRTNSVARPPKTPANSEARQAIRQITEVPSESARPAQLEVSGPTTGMEEIDTVGTGLGNGEIVDHWGFDRQRGEPPVAEEPPIILRPDMEAPILLRRVDPTYPEVAVKTKVKGVVILEAIINTSGHVVDARILRDIGMGCGQAALNAVRQWQYQPARLNGRATAVYLTVTVRFELT